MPNSRHIYNAVIPFLAGSVAITLGLVILVFTQVVNTAYWRAGMAVGLPLVIVGGLIVFWANMASRANLRGPR